VIVSLILAALIVLATAVELVVPGAKLYNTGWYNVVLAALVIVLMLRVRKAFSAGRSGRGRTGAILAAFGVAAVGVAGVSFGLFAPDPQTIVGAPGSSVSVEGVTLRFPLIDEGLPSRSLSGSYLLEPVPRTVVRVEVADAAGRHLTTTQPTGVAFLSPVLLMQSTQSIAGIELPYDTFAVPAAHRIVKTVLLTQQAISNMPTLAGIGQAVLFDVEDENETEVRGGIGVAPAGVTKLLGGLRLQANLVSYPAIRMIGLPNPLVVVLGILAAIVGITMLVLDLRARPALA